jgi:CubicO group peptidase (beta-lactamase class C family)
MMLSRGELDGVRVLSPETVKLMTTNSLPLGVRFAQDMIGPTAGATWGLGFAIRTGTGSSVVPGSTGSFARSGVWGTSFWGDPVEKLIAIQMIQVTPEECVPYRALGDLTYDALCRRYRDAH